MEALAPTEARPAERGAPFNAKASRSVVASLRANVSWTLLGNVAYAGCQWGMLVSFAKLGQARMVGEYGLGLAITAPVFMFANLQLGSVLATDATGASTFADYFGARVTTTVAALVTSCVVAFATQGMTTTALVIAAVASAKAIESLSDIFHGLFQRRETMNRIAGSMVLRGASSLAAVIVALHLWRHAAAAAALMACTSAVVLIAFDVPNAAKLLGGFRRVFPCFSVRELVAMVRLAFPLGVVTMLISLTTNIPRYFLEHEGGARELGIFVGLAYVVTASAMVVGAVGRAVTPRLANLHAAGRLAGFRRLVRSLVLCSIALGAIGVLAVLVFGRAILEVVYTAEYAAYAREFAIVMLAGGIGYAGSLLGYAVTACRHFAAQIPLWIAIAAVTCLASAVLVPRLGVLGAAWALVLSAAVHLAGYAAFYVLRVVRARNG